MRRSFVQPLACSLALGLAAIASADRLFVDADRAGGADDGTSWADAFTGRDALARALAAAASGDEIWVAAGAYAPTTTTSRIATHTLASGRAVYGGFAGDETELDQRDVAANPTVLSGDLLENDTLSSASRTDNSYHVVVVTSSAGSPAILDGFTITAGNATSGTSDRDRGGGLISTNGGGAEIRNCAFIDNRCTFGGGACYLRSSDLTFIDCRFEDNRGGNFGGAFDTFSDADTTFIRCAFVGNNALRAGGVEAFANCDATFTNCLFHDNLSSGTGGGGAIFLANASTAVLRGCTVVENRSNVSIGGGIFGSSSTAQVFNSIVRDNVGPGGSQSFSNQISVSGTTIISFSNVEGVTSGSGNIDDDPAYTDAIGGDFTLAAGSVGIDAGRNGLAGVGVTTDLLGNDRFVDDPDTPDTGSGTAPLVDMGAYEFQPEPPACPADIDGDGVVSGADLAILLGSWGGKGGPADLDGSGIVSGADLAILLGSWGACL